MKYNFNCIRLEYSIIKRTSPVGYYFYSMYDMILRFHSNKIVESLISSPFSFMYRSIIFRTSECIFGILLNLIGLRTKGHFMFIKSDFSIYIPKSSNYFYG